MKINCVIFVGPGLWVDKGTAKKAPCCLPGEIGLRQAEEDWGHLEATALLRVPKCKTLGWNVVRANIIHGWLLNNRNSFLIVSETELINTPGDSISGEC